MIRLREITKQDMKVINRWRNDEGLVDYLGAPFRYVNPETDEVWFDNYMKNRSSQIRCAICPANPNRNEVILGVVYLTQIDSVSRQGEFSIMIGETGQRNKGIGTMATRQMLHYAFDSLNLHRVYLYVLEHNQRAIAVYEKAGFIKEGVLRDSVYKKGNYENLVLMGILDHDFRSNYALAGKIHGGDN